MSHEDIVNEALAHNAEVFMEHGPRLTFDYTIYVIEKDTAKGRIHLGGLGSMGAGSMWMDDAPGWSVVAGYAEAPEGSEP